MKKFRHLKVCREEIVSIEAEAARFFELYSEMLEEKKTQHQAEESRNLATQLELLTQQNSELRKFVECIEEKNACYVCADTL